MSSHRLIAKASRAIFNYAMKTVDDLRRANLHALSVEFGGVGALATLLDRSSSQVSQWMNGTRHSVSGKPRRLSSDSARYIEGKCGKPDGWLDADHGHAASVLDEDADVLDVPFKTIDAEIPASSESKLLADAAELLRLFSECDAAGRAFIISAARNAVRAMLSNHNSANHG